MKLHLTKDARDFLLDINEPKRFGQIVRKILGLLGDPYPSDSQELKGYGTRHADIGEYRIVYRYIDIDDLLQVILVSKRNDDEVYKKLKR